METSEIRKRLLQTIQRVRRDAAARRAAIDEAQRHYPQFLTDVAAPVFKQFANALKAEGLAFMVFTPADSVRLSSDRAAEDYVELVLDTSRETPTILGRKSVRRGGRTIASERPVREGAKVAEVTAEDVVTFVLEELEPFLER